MPDQPNVGILLRFESCTEGRQRRCRCNFWWQAIPHNASQRMLHSWRQRDEVTVLGAGMCYMNGRHLNVVMYSTNTQHLDVLTGTSLAACWQKKMA